MTFLKSLALAAPFALALNFSAAADDGVRIAAAFALTSGKIGGTAAVYLEVENHQNDADLLLSASSDAARKVTIHHSAESADGVMSMAETALPIPALGFLALRPGQDHVMQMGLTRTLAAGDVITLTLIFERAGAVTIAVPVTDAAPAGGQENPPATP